MEAEVSEMQETKLPCSQMVVGYYKAANAIDVHNKMRQGVLHIATSHRTDKWWYRLFLSVLGTLGWRTISPKQMSCRYRARV